MNKTFVQTDATPIDLSYEADLCGNIEQALKGLQGYGIMALELIQNADDAGAKTLSFDARADALVVAKKTPVTLNRLHVSIGHKLDISAHLRVAHSARRAYFRREQCSATAATGGCIGRRRRRRRRWNQLALTFKASSR